MDASGLVEDGWYLMKEKWHLTVPNRDVLHLSWQTYFKLMFGDLELPMRNPSELLVSFCHAIPCTNEFNFEQKLVVYFHTTYLH
jgi:hypothetical protein